MDNPINLKLDNESVFTIPDPESLAILDNSDVSSVDESYGESGKTKYYKRKTG